jgi:hypothetical protein
MMHLHQKRPAARGDTRGVQLVTYRIVLAEKTGRFERT